jgi:peptide/nickel transport system substrate-binding protein
VISHKSGSGGLRIDVNRRRFLAGLGIGAGAIALAACGANNSGGSSASGEGLTGGKIPDTTFVDLFGTVPATFDPAQGINSANTRSIPNWSSTLVNRAGADLGAATLPAANEVVPYLAESWEAQPDGGYIFTLRQNVKSAAGNVLTTKDVQYSFDRLKVLDFVAQAELRIGNVNLDNPVEILDDRRFKLNVTAPSPSTLGVLCWFGVGILDSTLLQANASPGDTWSAGFFNNNSATFGAYSVVKFEPEVAVTLKANPNHWAPPFFTDVIIRAVADPSSRLQLMQSGEANLTSNLTWAQFDQAASAGGLQAAANATSAMQFLIAQEANSPMNKVEVRQAMSLALDRQKLVDTIFLGHAKPATAQLPSSYQIDFNPGDLAKRDVKKAKELLATAGYPDGVDIELSGTPAYSGDYLSDLLVLMQSQLAEAGIRTSVRVVASSTEYSGMVKAVQSSYSQVSPDPADPASFLGGTWSTASKVSAGTRYGYNNPEVQTQIVAATKMAAGSERDTLLGQIYNTINNDMPGVPVIEPTTQVVADGSIKGLKSYSYPVTYYEYLSR